VSGPISNVSSPLKRGRVERAAGRLGESPRTAPANAFECSGVEPQQDPAMFS
jgi:hypothetical protein